MGEASGATWTDWIQAIAVVVALLFAAYQTRRLVVDARKRDRDVRIERALDMYRDLVVDGDTANAFHRLSVRLRSEGFTRFSVVTWKLPTDEDLEPGGLMDPTSQGDQTLFADLYRVMWYFERADLAMTHGLIDQEVFFQAAGFHTWWWNEILRNIHQPKAMSAVRHLASQVVVWAGDSGALAEWAGKCQTDFDSGPPATASTS